VSAKPLCQKNGADAFSLLHLTRLWRYRSLWTYVSQCRVPPDALALILQGFGLSTFQTILYNMIPGGIGIVSNIL
jgi:hypothetical protein